MKTRKNYVVSYAYDTITELYTSEVVNHCHHQVGATIDILDVVFECVESSTSMRDDKFVHIEIFIPVADVAEYKAMKKDAEPKLPSPSADC